MKKHYFFYETLIFFTIFTLFVCPSIFQNRTETDTFSEWPFPLIQIIYFAFSMFLLFCQIVNNEAEFHFVKLSSITKKNIFITFFSFFALILISLTFQFLGIIADYKANQVKLNYPYNIQQKLFCLLTFAFTAGFEEIVFRYILPESMQHIIKSKNNEKYKIISCEIITAILFGLCHNYLGLLAVLNGVCAHFIFRLCYKKTGNLLFNCSIHFLYNVTNVFICSI